MMFNEITSVQVFVNPGLYFYAKCKMYFVLYSCCNNIGCITDVTVMSDDGYVFIVKKSPVTCLFTYCMYK